MNVYYIGGSPGSGKSSIAKQIAKQFGFAYYKLDDFLFTYNKKAAKEGKEHSVLARALNGEQTWMREPQMQMTEEIGIYEEIFQYALADIEKLAASKTVIAEGAGFMPKLMAMEKVLPSRYICVVPTEEFQRKVFEKRLLLKLFLIGCKDKNAAFENWMVRDALFAKEIFKQAEDLGYTALLVDGSKTIAENYDRVIKTFELAL